MNHRTANGRLWLLTGWRAWVVSFGAVLAAVGIVWTAMASVYPMSPWGFDERLDRDEAQMAQQRERQEKQEEQAAKALRSDARFKQLAAVILTQPNSRDTPEVADAKRRMRRMFVIDPENGFEERGR